MRNLITLIIILFCLNISFGQNVGIGTSVPISKLHVVGDLRVTWLPDSLVNFIVLADSFGRFYRISNQFLLSSCPPGFISIYDTSGVHYIFSIETNTHPPATWFNASKFCGDRGLRLCTTSEWYIVCQRGVIPSMGSNDEWIDDFVHEDNILIIGGSACDDTGVEHESTLVSFRCCCDK